MKISKISLLLFLTLLTNSTYAVKKVYTSKEKPCISLNTPPTKELKKRLKQQAREIILYHYTGIIDLFVAKQDLTILTNSTYELKEKIKELPVDLKEIIKREHSNFLNSKKYVILDKKFSKIYIETRNKLVEIFHDLNMQIIELNTLD